jgi:AcrR family transcriptional regulator
MAAPKRNPNEPSTRDALLDGARTVMLRDGYAAATTRKVAAEAGVNSALVSYYFDSLDGMFVELFRRGAEQSFERLQQALASDQPLWAFWELIHDRSNSALTMEFIALANHRKTIREEIADYSRRFRKAQVDSLHEVFDRYGVDSGHWPTEVLVVILSAISRYLLIEKSFDVDIGHAETEAMVRRYIAELEGERSAA